MPTLIRGLTIVLFLAASPRFASAGGPVQSLPKDGCWVKFFLEVELSEADGVVHGKHTGSWTISSVGMKTVNGEKCRWIEIEEHIDKADDGKPLTRWFKFLVREKDLKPGGDLLGHLVEYWHKEGRNKAVKRTDSSWLMLPMFLHNTPKIGRPVTKAKRVMWQKGAFTIPKAEEQTQTISGKENRLRVTVRDLVWKKADIPFGTAAVNSSLRLIRNGKHAHTWVRKLSLADYGTNAKSKLPEAK